MMETDLFPRLVGKEAWERLSPAVRRCHEVSPVLLANARLTITRGESLLARVACRLLRFPPAREAIPTALEARAERGQQRWTRSFDGHPMVTTQYEVAGRLAERAGLVEVHMRLEEQNGALVYRSERARVCLFGLRIPLPSVFSPTIVGRAAPAETNPETMMLEIRVSSPIAGMLMTYTGPVDPQ